ncbi:hypothetical protein SAMN05428997_1152 [Bosea sp. CRIB-10]|uniref:hypothetical protein n=1 Tax=Bosea sp. CRIB-10 TaxID=378404 RepID=UPI0008F2A84F|nr:hypothetical protein [Bosea sp. CRIB-10]SFC97847.1 hypothetical protein SAMN05428997_1152 [Bosea sp. CRIB-10]
MATIRIPVYAQDSHNYLTSSDHVHYSWRSAESFVHTYAEPMSGRDTGCIDYSAEDSRLIGHIVAPAGSKTYVSVCEMECLALPGDRSGYDIYEAVMIAKAGECGLSWERAQ